MFLKSQTQPILVNPPRAFRPPKETWAEMARREGHRPSLPETAEDFSGRTPGRHTGTRQLIIYALREIGPAKVSQIMDYTGLSRQIVGNHVQRSKRQIRRINERPEVFECMEWAIYDLVKP